VMDKMSILRKAINIINEMAYHYKEAHGDMVNLDANIHLWRSR
jgi:hypothetical protein